MSGSISLSLSQQFDELGNPLEGGRLWFYEAGTVATPQNAYQDSGLTIAHPNPIVLDAAGRVPAFYLADGEIKIKLTSSTGVTQIEQDNILVIGPSSGSGGGGGVDSTTVAQTGDLKVRYGTGAHSGWVRLNGRTIGSATSGANERANADCEDLFVHLWNEDENLTVSTGRGDDAASDWAANKTITLPDGRGYALAALADMGSTTATIFTGATFTSGDATTLGSKIGTARRTLTSSQIPVITPTGTISGTVTVNGEAGEITYTSRSNGTGAAFNAWGPGGASGSSNVTFAGSFSGNTWNSGGGQAHDTISPYLLATVYMKL